MDLAEQNAKDLTTWAQAQKKRLMDACVKAGHNPETLKAATLNGHPFGNWKFKGVLFSDGKAIAQFWLSFRRLNKRSKVTVPRFNVETSDEIANAMEEA